MSEKETKNISPSKATAAKTIYEAFKILKSEGGELPGKEVIDRIRQNVQFTDWEKEVYEKTGYVRWEAILHFYTVDCAKAGYLRKSRGVWYLTPEGEQAMKLGSVGLLESASTLAQVSRPVYERYFLYHLTQLPYPVTLRHFPKAVSIKIISS